MPGIHISANNLFFMEVKMKKVLKFFALFLVVAMLCTAFAACEPTTPATPTEAPSNTDAPETTDAPEATAAPYTGADTLVVGYSRFSGKFSPFFATTAYDQDVAGMVSVGLISTDREGNVVYNGIAGEKRNFNGKEYTYTSMSDVKETINNDGSVDYNIKLRQGVKFSDGKDLTIDDVIFSIYVICDPTYNGSTTFSALPIEGMKDYLSNVSSVMALIKAAGINGKSDLVSAEDTAAFWDAYNKAGVKFAQTISDYCFANYGDYYPAYVGFTADEAKDDNGLKTAAGMALWNFGAVKDGVLTTKSGKTYTLSESKPTAEDYWTEIAAAYGNDPDAIEAEKASDTLASLIEIELGDKVDAMNKGVVTGDSAANIKGIVKVNDYELNIKMTEFDATAIYHLGVTIAPLHYYGDAAQYDYANNKFGFPKGDLASIKAKTSNPLGAGAYTFQDYSNGVVTFKRNEGYFDGCPKITYIKFQETDDADKVPGVQSGTFDVTDPSFNDTAVNAIKKANDNGEITGNIITTSTVDNLGYGYIGANATTVKVGDDPASAESKALRKAFATLFAVHRDTNVYSYYKERASVIQYPISNTSWAAPKPNDEGYALAYSKDVDGKAIYTADMTEAQKYEAALNAAIGFFKKAGYTWDDSAKKFTAAPAGAQMEYEVIVPADGVGDHPAYGVLTDTKADLEKIGITLNINDPSDSNVLWDSLDAGTQNFWAAAWGAAVDPDMYQVYYSQNVVGIEGSSESNHYRIQDPTLDEKIMAARKSADHAYRKAVYKECLDIIMDWGVEIPTYQRQNAIIFSTERVNMSTVTPDITTFWGWMNDIQNLEMNPAK